MKEGGIISPVKRGMVSGDFLEEPLLLGLLPRKDHKSSAWRVREERPQLHSLPSQVQATSQNVLRGETLVLSDCKTEDEGFVHFIVV